MFRSVHLKLAQSLAPLRYGIDAIMTASASNQMETESEFPTQLIPE
jgi:hypothetical protein